MLPQNLLPGEDLRRRFNKCCQKYGTGMQCEDIRSVKKHSKFTADCKRQP